MSMVPAAPADGALPARSDDDDTGLEDLGFDELVMPRIAIDHERGEFVDSLSKERWTELSCVVLGLIKQRVLWPAEMTEKAEPLCRSLDFNVGRPNEKEFPWGASGFDQSGANREDDGQIVLPCQGCALKDWGTHPKGDNPWCSEQHVLLILIDGRSPALFTIQRSGLKPSRAYLSYFKTRKIPAYTAWTTISLRQERKGSNRYSVPQFAKGADTDQAQWGDFATSYRQARSFIQTPRRREDEADDPQAEAQQPGAHSAPLEQPPASQPADQPVPPRQQPPPSVPAPTAAASLPDDADPPF